MPIETIPSGGKPPSHVVAVAFGPTAEEHLRRGEREALDRLLHESEVAELLSVKVTTLRRWRWARKGPAWIKVGGCVRYRRRDVDAFIEANRQGPYETLPQLA
jgi:excisionase family DNA binding protein